jgi:hypothetical protein
VAFDPVRDDPIVQHLLARAGLDQLPQGPGVGLPYGAPERQARDARSSDVERAASPEWRDQATHFAETYPGLTLADRTLAGLADAGAAARARLCFAMGDAAVAQELLPVLTDVRAAMRPFWATPTGQQALALGERHAAALDYQASLEALAERLAAAQDHQAALETLAHRDAAALDAQVYTRSWNRRLAAELGFLEAHVAWLQQLCRYVAQPPIPADAADPRREALARPSRRVGGTGVPNRQLGSQGRVAADVADYLAAHHPDGKRVWADVVLVMEFYGWKLGNVAVQYKARALEQAARRARSLPEDRATVVPKRQV